MNRDAIVEAIALEELIEQHLRTQARLGIRSEIPHAQIGYEASSARRAALQQLLEAASSEYR